MKLRVASFISAALLGSSCPLAQAVDMRDLSMTPFERCKKPPKAPPHALLHKTYKAFGTATNYPFNDTVDINGDGLCDWVSVAARPPHRGDVEEPPLNDFIFLGSPNGWRRLGDLASLESTESALKRSGLPAFGFIYPTFVYARADKRPFVAVLHSFEDIAPRTQKDIFVVRWNNKLDLPDAVSNEDRAAILGFLRRTLCNRGKSHDVEESMAEILCAEPNK